MGAFLRLTEKEACATYDDIMAMIDKSLNDLLDIKSLRTTVDESDVVDAERRLHLGHLIQFIEDYIGVGVRFEFDDDAHALVIRLVVDVGDTVEFFLGDELGDIFYEFGLVDAVRNLTDDDRLMVGL